MSRLFDDMALGSIELFCLTAEHQGFTAAAQVTGLSPAAVSRSVARLEARLGVQLLVRTTRRVRLTEAGQRYHLRCRQALGQLQEAEREATEQAQLASGLVRLSLPTSYAHYRVLPVLPDFLQMCPHIELELQLTNRNVDFTDERFDLAVRGRAPPDSGLVARKLEDADLVVVASPDYLRRHPAPQGIEDLSGHECIQFVLPRTGQNVPWLLQRGGRIEEVVTRGRLACSDDILGPVTLARAGAGVLQTYRYLVERDLAEGRLVALLPACAGASRPFSLIYPGNRHMPLRVRAVIDFLVSRLGPGGLLTDARGTADRSATTSYG
jgi:DNA-binding transcriptional LysR family regulator